MVWARDDADLDLWWSWRWEGVGWVKYISETTGEKVNAVGRVFYKRSRVKVVSWHQGRMWDSDHARICVWCWWQYSGEEDERVLVQRVSRRAGMSAVPVRQLVSVTIGVLSVSEDSLGTLWPTQREAEQVGLLGPYFRFNQNHSCFVNFILLACV